MIKNIILDFGGVLIPIDERRTWDAFSALGAKKELKDQTETFQDYETGKISTNQFLKKIQPHFFRTIFLQDLADAWNALLDPLPKDVTFFLKRLNKDYRVFLLSNTNELHISAISETAGPFEFTQFLKQFEKVYYSHETGLRKPDPKIFKKVMKDNGLVVEETFYVDDGEQHIESAKKLGIQTWHFNPKKDSIRDLGKVLSKHH